jgi:hypothetical protein
MKTILNSLLVILLSSATYGQSLFKAENLSSSWAVLAENESVLIEISKSECMIEGVSKPFEYAFLKITNKTNLKHNINFQIGSWFGGSCIDCEANAETIRSVQLEPGATLVGDCSFKYGQLSMLLRNPFIPASDVKFDGFQLLNLNVK